MENIVSLLLSRIESLIQERQKYISLEQTMIMLMQKIEKLEHEVRQIRERENEKKKNT
jgi:hypothetical protein